MASIREDIFQLEEIRRQLREEVNHLESRKQHLQGEIFDLSVSRDSFFSQSNSLNGFNEKFTGDSNSSGFFVPHGNYLNVGNNAALMSGKEMPLPAQSNFIYSFYEEEFDNTQAAEIPLTEVSVPNEPLHETGRLFNTQWPIETKNDSLLLKKEKYETRPMTAKQRILAESQRETSSLEHVLLSGKAIEKPSRPVIKFNDSQEFKPIKSDLKPKARTYLKSNFTPVTKKVSHTNLVASPKSILPVSRKPEKIISPLKASTNVDSLVVREEIIRTCDNMTNLSLSPTNCPDSDALASIEPNTPRQGAFGSGNPLLLSSPVPFNTLLEKESLFNHYEVLDQNQNARANLKVNLVRATNSELSNDDKWSKVFQQRHENSARRMALMNASPAKSENSSGSPSKTLSALKQTQRLQLLEQLHQLQSLQSKIESKTTTSVIQDLDTVCEPSSIEAGLFESPKCTANLIEEFKEDIPCTRIPNSTRNYTPTPRKIKSKIGKNVSNSVRSLMDAFDASYAEDNENNSEDSNLDLVGGKWSQDFDRLYSTPLGQPNPRTPFTDFRPSQFVMSNQFPKPLYNIDKADSFSTPASMRSVSSSILTPSQFHDTSLLAESCESNNNTPLVQFAYRVIRGEENSVKKLNFDEKKNLTCSEKYSTESIDNTPAKTRFLLSNGCRSSQTTQFSTWSPSVAASQFLKPNFV